MDGGDHIGFQRVRGTVDDDGEASEGHWEVLLKEVSERLPISRRQWPTVKAAAKAKPGAMNDASAGAGSATQLTAERFRLGRSSGK